jgi:hypothetical protein
MPGFGGGGGMGGGMMPMGGGNKAKKPEDDTIPLDKPIIGAVPRKYHKGGRVRKSGWAKVKRKEVVLTPKQAETYKKTMKRKSARKRG